MGLSLSESGLDSTSAFHSAHLSPDVCVAFDIFLRVNGLFVNLRDWFDAFKAALRSSGQTQPGEATEAAAAGAASSRKKVGARKLQRRGGAGDAGAAGAGSSAPSAGSDPLSDVVLQARVVRCLRYLSGGLPHRPHSEAHRCAVDFDLASEF